MLLPGNNARVWLCTEPTDMRKNYNGLSALVKHRLGDIKHALSVTELQCLVDSIELRMAKKYTRFSLPQAR